MEMTMRIMQGHYRTDGGSLERGTLMVEQTPAGFRDAEGGFELRADRYAVTADIASIAITSPQATYEFIPDAGECERVGMPVEG